MKTKSNSPSVPARDTKMPVNGALRALCVFSYVLGGNTFSRTLKSQLEQLPQLPQLALDELSFLEKDFSNYRLPAYAKLSSSIRVHEIMKLKLVGFKKRVEDYDILVFQSFHLTSAFRSAIRRTPTIIALDSTPRLAHRGNLKAYGIRVVPNMVLSRLIDAIWFGPIFRQAAFFLARTEAVRQSLIKDYGVRADKIEVTYIPLPIATPREPSSEDGVKFLFVGNDFERKGGWFLLDALNQVHGQFSLTIISHDPTLKNHKWPHYVRYLGGLPREEVLNLYGKHDVFLMPTWKDEAGLAICEAVASGLPVIVRDATAQKEFVGHGESGYLMEYKAGSKDWATKMQDLVDDVVLREKFRANALARAKVMFSESIFSEKVNAAVARAAEEVGTAHGCPAPPIKQPKRR